MTTKSSGSIEVKTDLRPDYFKHFPDDLMLLIAYLRSYRIIYMKSILENLATSFRKEDYPGCAHKYGFTVGSAPRLSHPKYQYRDGNISLNQTKHNK